MIYVRWRRGESRRGRVFPAPAANHPIYGTTCVYCGTGFYGDSGEIQLVAVGPVDKDERARHEADRWYKAGAVVLHRADVDAMTDLELDEPVCAVGRPR